MPVTFRYSLLTGLVLGFVHTMSAKQSKYFFYHLFTFLPLGTFGLCH
jgi:hypothetical protein